MSIVKDLIEDACMECINQSKNLFNQKLKKSYDDDDKDRKGIVFIQEDSKKISVLIEWKNIEKNKKMKYITEYLKEHGIAGTVKSYAFSKIVFDEKNKKIKSLAMRKLN